ncbi:MAG: V-type ATPase 116kDa subunit family protein [Gallionellaceae bacterium]|nr:V-type ATPase 116kDa subunit family protein [Gallionellaceae bacterium]
MFKAKPMLKVELLCLASETQEMALLLARHGGFGPAGKAGVASGEHYRELYLEAAARLDKIMEYCGHHDAAPIPDDAIAPNERELAGINHRLQEIWQACSGCHEQETRMAEEKERLAMLRETYARLSTLAVDPARLLRRDGLLDTRLGQIPAGNLKRLGDALSVAGYLLTVFDRAGDQAFVVVAGPRSEDGQAANRLGGLLTQAGWRDLPVPPELRTDPSVAARYLESEHGRLEAMVADHCELRQQHWQQHALWLRQAAVLLTLARPLAESSLLGLSGKGQLAVFSGWVPEGAAGALKEALAERFHGRYLLVTHAPGPEDTGKVPSLLTYPAWLRPFTGLVKSYGVPRYGEFDPALLFAFGYVLLFGAMFGDVGHGAVLLVGAMLLHGRLAWLRWVGAAAGLASIGFGLLYGSVFGYEALIAPVWQSPMHDPTRMLWLAVAFGAGFISVTLLINIYNRLSAKRPGHAFLAGDGLAGLVFYLAAIAGLSGLLAGEGAGVLSAVTAGLALIAMATWAGREASGPVGERLVVALVESLETAINLFANTLSFLRVAAFSLNHVALTLAVFTIATGLDTMGHGVAVVLGNIVIIVLEGGIVAIQALRLMYYEGFSRFFAGDGVEFRPLKLVLQEKRSGA